MTKSERVAADLSRRLSRNLKRIRGERGMTFEQVGVATGLHWRHVQKIEAGDSNVTLKTLARLAKGLEVDVSELTVKRSAK